MTPVLNEGSAAAESADSIVTQFENLSLAIQSENEDLTSLSTALENVKLDDQDNIALLDNPKEEKCDKVINEEESTIEANNSTLEAKNNLCDESKLEKLPSSDDVTFDPNLGIEEDYTSDENNESYQDSDFDDKDCPVKVSLDKLDKPRNDIQEEKSLKNLHNKYITRTPFGEGQSNQIGHFSPISATAFDNGYRDSASSFHLNYNDGFYQQQDFSINNGSYISTFNEPSFSVDYSLNNNEAQDICGNDYAGFFNQDVDSAENPTLFGYLSNGDDLGLRPSVPQSQVNDSSYLANNILNDDSWKPYDMVDNTKQIQSLIEPSCSPSSDGFPYYEPLTPPKSVSPTYNIYDEKNERELIDMLTAINNNSQNNSVICHEEKLRYLRTRLEEPDADAQDLDVSSIGRDEMDIYLSDNENPLFDRTKARLDMFQRCDSQILEKVNSCIAKNDTSSLCKKDEQGDSALSIICSKDKGDPMFYEQLYALTERLKKIDICCDKPIGKSRRCQKCNNSNPDRFHTPLSSKNKEGDTPLGCFVKTNQCGGEVVVNFLLCELMDCPEDIRREFDQEGLEFYTDPRILFSYPIFEQFR